MAYPIKGFQQNEAADKHKDYPPGN